MSKPNGRPKYCGEDSKRIFPTLRKNKIAKMKEVIKYTDYKCMAHVLENGIDLVYGQEEDKILEGKSKDGTKGKTKYSSKEISQSIRIILEGKAKDE